MKGMWYLLFPTSFLYLSWTPLYFPIAKSPKIEQSTRETKKQICNRSYNYFFVFGLGMQIESKHAMM